MTNDIKINHITYQVRRIHSGSESASALIRSRILQELESQKALTPNELIVYNNRGRSVRAEEAI